MHLKGINGYKIVLGNSLEDYGILLRIKAQLKKRFFVRNVDNELEGGFTVLLCKEDVESLEGDIKALVRPLSDEGVERVCVSGLYRFIPDKYINDFVINGKIWLSTFNRCQQLEDKNRTDGNEGKVEFYYNDKKVANANVGRNGYLLCASTTPFASGSKPDGQCVYIRDLPGLIAAINKGLRDRGIKISAIVQGPCVYANHKVCLEFDLDRTPEMLESLLVEYGDRVYFIKDALPQFVVEHEYRVVWLTDGETEKEGLLVQIEKPELYVQSIAVPAYTSMCNPPIVAARNHPYVIPPQMIAKGREGVVKTV